MIFDIFFNILHSLIRREIIRLNWLTLSSIIYDTIDSINYVKIIKFLYVIWLHVICLPFLNFYLHIFKEIITQNKNEVISY